MKKEYFNIPNLMGYFRILLIPVFLVFYANADTGHNRLIALIVLGLSYLTDFLDGKIARKFNMVTDWGKVLDPVADKLTQGAMAVALSFYYPLIVWFLALFLCKELYMGIMGLYLIKKNKAIQGAQRYGKLCTAVINAGAFLLILCPDLSIMMSNLIIYFMMLMVCITFICYIRFHISIIREKENKKIKVWLLLLIILIYIIVGGITPYIRQPKVSDAYQNAFHAEDFYASEYSSDRAAVIEDNGEALTERLRMIEQAEDSIILSTFDFRSDVSGKKMLAALKAAAERGVHVQILVDGVSGQLRMEGNPYFYALASNENVEIKIYNPVNPLLPWRGMSRLHDKYVIADESVYILGGRNTFDYFLGNQKGHKNIDRDVFVYNTGGTDSSVYQVMDYFAGVWNLGCCRKWHGGGSLTWIPSVKKADRELDALYNEMKLEHGDWFESVDYEAKTVPVNKITLLSNPTGLYAKEPWVFYGLSRLIEDADSEVLIHTPYIMCNDMMYETFRNVCSGDASVTLMTNSAANNGNPFGSVDYVMNKEKILDTDLQILEYEGGISYHGKSMTIDDDIAIIGSFNMDMKSVYQDTELMLVVNSRELNEQLKEHLLSYQQDAREAVLDEGEMDALFKDDVSGKKKLLRWLIKTVDPYLRFLL